MPETLFIPRIFTNCFLLIPKNKGRFHIPFLWEVVSNCKYLCGKKIGINTFHRPFSLVGLQRLIILACCYGKRGRRAFWRNYIPTSQGSKFMRINKHAKCYWEESVCFFAGGRPELYQTEEKQRRNCDPWFLAMRPLLVDSSDVKMKWNIYSAVKKIINEPLISKWRPKGITRPALNLKREKWLHVWKNTKSKSSH